MVWLSLTRNTRHSISATSSGGGGRATKWTELRSTLELNFPSNLSLHYFTMTECSYVQLSFHISQNCPFIVRLLFRSVRVIFLATLSFCVLQTSLWLIYGVLMVGHMSFAEKVAVWCSGNALVLINRSCSTSSPVSTGMGDCLRVGKLPHYIISHPGQLSLAISPWVGEMSTGDVTTTVREENGEFCVLVAPATRTAGILT